MKIKRGEFDYTRKKKLFSACYRNPDIGRVGYIYFRYVGIEPKTINYTLYNLL